MNILDNLRVLRAAVAAQPEADLNLESWRCGTMFCIGGLAASMPHFQKMGMRSESRTGAPQPPIGAGGDVDEALNMFFEPYPNAVSESSSDSYGEVAYGYIFAQYGEGVWDHALMDENPDMSHKELSLARLDRAIEYWEAE